MPEQNQSNQYQKIDVTNLTKKHDGPNSILFQIVNGQYAGFSIFLPKKSLREEGGRQMLSFLPTFKNKRVDEKWVEDMSYEITADQIKSALGV